MTISCPRLAAFALLAAAAILPCSTALGAGSKPTPPPAKPGSTKPTPTATPAAPGALMGGTLQEVEKAMLVKRYEAVLAYVRANPKASDAEEAGRRVVDLAESCELWDKTVAHCDEFLAAWPSSKERVDVVFTRAGALAHEEKVADAKKAYQDLIKDLDVQKDGAQTVWNVYSTYAQFLADNDDVEGAKAAYEEVKAKIEHPQIAALADNAVKALAILGSEPTAFPDGAKDMDGKTLSLADFKGKVTMIDFWATWCGPCREEMPNVVAAYKKWHDKGFEIVGVSLDNKGEDAKVKAFTKEHEMPWRQFFDGGGWGNEIAVLYEVHGIPHTILIGKDGKVVKTNVRGPALDKAISKLLK